MVPDVRREGGLDRSAASLQQLQRPLIRHTALVHNDGQVCLGAGESYIGAVYIYMCVCVCAHVCVCVFNYKSHTNKQMENQ